ncbi:SDR family NAD(P)-dependent oxidoreductase [Streptomyces sp. NBUA17]|uniref:SDR family NAD(P)-dependent oxidoreductase n=1 Tax=Streptomyces sp. NBUA17 TaxID=3062275 RepID=UPI0037DA2E0B
MVALPLPVGRVRELLAEHGEVSLAAVNGPVSTVVAGGSVALERLLADCGERGIRARRVAVDYASHSRLVERIEERLLGELAPVVPRSAEVPVFSSVTGGLADTVEWDAGYWYRNLRSTVRFEEALTAALDVGDRVVLEVSPHPVLVPAVQDVVDGRAGVVPVGGTLRRGEGSLRRMVTAVAQASVQGVAVDWGKVFAGREAVRVPLPTYAFQHERYWPEPEPPVAPVAPDPVDERFWASVEKQDVRSLAETLGLDSDVVAAMVPALASWRARRRDEDAADGWRYRETWKPLVGNRTQATSGRRLVVVPAGKGKDAWVSDVVAALGAGTLVLEHGDDAVSGDRLRAALGTDVPVTAVLSLIVALEADTSTALAHTTTLLRALADTGAPPLWAVTRGAVSVGGRDPLTAPEQGAAWGLGRVAALDQPGVWGGLVDLPEVLDMRSARLLAAVLSGTSGEDQVAVRPSGLFGRRLVHAPALRPRAESWTTSGTALITGGTGGLGAYVARWLVRRGSEHIVLVSRRGPDAEGVAPLRLELEADGADVTVVACDVVDRAALADVLAALPEDRPLRTVVHAAGVVGDTAPLPSTTRDQLEWPMRAKVDGARHLDDLTRGLDLDAFVLFSSGAAAWGSGGQAGYAAGNAFLDALALHRRARGRTATSVAWGSWDEAGMLSGSGVAQRDALNAMGVVPMAPELAITELEHAVREGEASLVVTDMDWARFAPVFTALRPSALLSDLPEVRAALTSGEPDAEASGALRGRLTGLSAPDRERAVLELVRGSAAAVLGHASGTRVPREKPFNELGFDSLTAVELRNLLQTETGAALPASAAFDYPTAARLARHLSGLLEPDAAGEAEGSSVAEPPPDDDETALLTADVDDLIDLALRED